MKRLFAILLFNILVLRIFSYTGNTLTFSQLSTKDGLSQNTVRCILEDKKGFIWAGTVDGINRYDGNQIITFKPQIGNLKSLPDHRIKDVFEDRSGLLWIKTYNNEFCSYNPEFECFTKFTGESVNEPLQFNSYYESTKGDIWLWGNINGCMRIKKGKEVTSDPFSPVAKHKLTHKNVQFLFEDSQSTIWVGCEIGLNRISGSKQTERFFDKGKRYSFIKAIEIKGKIYFVTKEQTIIVYNQARRTFIGTYGFTIQHKNTFIDATKTSNNELLIATQYSGLLSFNPVTKAFGKPSWINDQSIKGLIQLIIDKNGGIWIYNHTGVVWYHNIQNGKTKQFTLIPPDIAKIIDFERYNVFIDSKKLIWITTYGNGLFCYDPKTDVLANYKYSTEHNSPASDYLLSITEDHSGNIWLGSEYAGIIKVVKQSYNVQFIRPEKENSIGKSNNVRVVYEDSQSNIWLGTKNGSLYLYDKELKNEFCLRESLNPYTLIEDNKRRIWIGTKGNGLYVMNSANFQEIAHYTNDANENNSLSNNTIFHILKDSKGRIWVGSFGGGINLVQESVSGTTFKRFFYNAGNKSYIRHLFQDSKGRIWAGSSEGIIRFNPDKLIKDPKAYESFQFNIDKQNSLTCNDIKTIFEDSKGQIWIGTAGGGINKYIEATKEHEGKFIAYTTKDGLSGDIVSGIMEGPDHCLWISSESGITKFDQQQLTFMTYFFSEKTYGNHFNENSCFHKKDGQMLWGSLDGLLMFNPKSFVKSNFTPPVVFTNFFLYDQKAEIGGKSSPLKKSITYSDKVKLTYEQNTFTIEFATLTLKEPENNKYTYILENYDKQWSAVSNSNSATYKNLPSGEYVFRVKGANSDGTWNEHTTELHITIMPPFWRSIYAYVFYTILLLLSLYAAFKIIYKFNRLNNAVEVEKQLTNHKLRFFTNISHEFRTPLTLIRGAIENLYDLDMTDAVRKQVNLLSRNSSHLTRLIDQLLEFRKIQNNVLTLNLEETDIIGFSRDIYTSFQELARQKLMNYQFICNVDTYTTYIDRGKVDKIIYNLLSNAFKFTPTEGKIDLVVNINKDNESCTISVKDNGIGIPKEKQNLIFSRFMQINFSSSGTGVGLSLVKEFVDVHKGKVWFENNEDQGSVFNVELPTSKSSYEGENFITSIKEADDKMLIDDTNLSTQETEAAPVISENTLANYNILIIDDNKDIRDFLTDEFSRHFHVDTAENGKQGLEKAIENNPNLIICDVMMPEMDGFEVTRRLKDEFQTCHIPIILLTAHSSMEHQLEGIQSGADAYIMKPFSLKYLLTRVLKLIEQRETLQRRFSQDSVFDGNYMCTTDKDKEFYDLINKILEDNIQDSQFSVDQFALLAKLRRTIFYKKIKGITGFSPNELIKIKRMKKAAELLLTRQYTVSEVSYLVGIEDPFYFSKCFKAQFNCSPSKYGQGREPKKGEEDKE